MSDIDPNQIKIIDNLLSHGIHQPTEKNQLRMSNKSIIADGITVIAFASDHLTSAKHLLRVVAGFFPSLLTDLFDAYRIKASLNNLKLDIYTVLCWLVALNTHTASTYLNVKRFFFPRRSFRSAYRSAEKCCGLSCAMWGGAISRLKFGIQQISMKTVHTIMFVERTDFN